MKLLVFLPNWIGDAVMATPTLRALRQRFSEARIAGLMRPVVADALERNPWLDDVIFHDPKSADARNRSWEVARRLRQEQFDMGVLLTNSMRSALLAWVGQVRRRVGYAREIRGLLLTDRLRPRRDRHGFIPAPMIDYYLEIAYKLGADKQSYQMELFVDPAADAQALSLFKRFGFSTADRVVVLNPGAAFGPAKRWPSQYFAQLAHRLVEERGAKVIVLCGPDERGFARFIADASLAPRHVKSLADEKLSIGLTKAIVRRSALLVSNDSGPRHFAAALDVPVISLFGPTHIAWTDTYYAKEIKLQRQLPCGPCQQRVCPLVHHRCMNELTVDEVFRHVAAVLDGTQPANATGLSVPDKHHAA